MVIYHIQVKHGTWIFLVYFGILFNTELCLYSNEFYMIVYQVALDSGLIPVVI
jgi:hypothetical protein